MGQCGTVHGCMKPYLLYRGSSEIEGKQYEKQTKRWKRTGMISCLRCLIQPCPNYVEMVNSS